MTMDQFNPLRRPFCSSKQPGFSGQDQWGKEMSTNAEAPIEIILIHGTFARRASWTDPEKSTLCMYLRQALGSHVSFLRFTWSGLNTFSAREKAADRLYEFVLQQPKHENRFIVAHSHGGSILAHALTKFPDLGDAIRGSVFLSTPFIQAKYRVNWKAIDYLIESTFNIFLRLWNWLAFIFIYISINVWESVTAVFAILIAWALSHEFSARLSGQSIFENIAIAVKDFFNESPDKSSNPITYPELPRLSEISCAKIKYTLHVNIDASKCLIVRTSADEASMALSFAHLLSVIASIILFPIIGLVALFAPMLFLGEMSDESEGSQEEDERFAAALLLAKRKGLIGKFAKFALWTGIISSLLGFIVGLIWKFGSAFGFHSMIKGPALDFVLYVLLAPVWLILALGLSLLPLFAVLYVFVLIAAIPFGVTASYGSLFMEFFTEATPRGQWSVFQAPSTHSNTSLMPQLAHSQSYENQHILNKIVEWVRFHKHTATKPARR